MKRFSIFFFFLMTTLVSFAQSQKGKLKVQVTADSKALEAVTVELLRTKDSALVKTALTDKNGWAEIDPISFGTYIVHITSMGYNGVYLNAVTIDREEVILPSTSLEARNSTAMQGVVVSAKKPFIQKLSDRIVVNVENSVVNAGSAAMDVLERSPGVTIDQNDVISLRGRSGVIIMIDGKPSPMTGADLANYLRGLPSNAIDRIEIITNPSSRYDASGNSGIIDIRMKKDQRLGSNGTFTAGYGQGIYPKANAGATFNYRDKKLNVFGNYNYSYRKNLNHLFINRNFYKDGVFKGSDDKDNFALMPFKTNTIRVGADYFPSSKTIVGFVVNSNLGKFDRAADNQTVINNLQGIPESKFYTNATNDDRNDNIVANINFKHRFDSTGKELTADADYGVFRSTSLTRTASSFYNLNGSRRKEDDILDGDQSGKLTLKTAKVDYVKPMPHGIKVEAGAKTSYVSSDNDAKFYNVTAAGSSVDETKTNRFFYEEYNNAGYVNFSKEYKKFSYQLGLRGEQTNIITRQVKGDRRFKNDYFQLFPSAFLNYHLKPEQTVGVSVSRRIDRPGYSQLNPFLFQIDATVYATGEPLLRPQITWSYELSYTLKNFNISGSYSHTNNPQTTVISRILDVIPNFEIKAGQDSNITVQIPVNLQSSDYYGLTASLPVKVAKWWNMINNVNLYYNHYNASIGGSQLNNGAPAASIRWNNNFTMNNGWSSEFSGMLNTGGRYGFSVARPQWALSGGVQKSILKNKATLRFNVTDIFWTNLPKSTITFEGNYVENWHALRESRTANLSFTYRFGNSKVQAARKRTTSSEEERQRAGN